MATKPTVSDAAFADFLKSKYKKFGLQTDQPPRPPAGIVQQNATSVPRGETTNHTPSVYKEVKTTPAVQGECSPLQFGNIKNEGDKIRGRGDKQIVITAKRSPDCEEKVGKSKKVGNVFQQNDAEVKKFDFKKEDAARVKAVADTKGKLDHVYGSSQVGLKTHNQFPRNVRTGRDQVTVVPKQEKVTVQQGLRQNEKTVGKIGEMNKAGPTREGRTTLQMSTITKFKTEGKVIESEAGKPYRGVHLKPQETDQIGQRQNQPTVVSIFSADVMKSDKASSSALPLQETMERREKLTALNTVFGAETLATASVELSPSSPGDAPKTPRLRRRVNLEQILKQKLKMTETPEVTSPPAEATSAVFGGEETQNLASAAFLRQLGIDPRTKLALQCPVCYQLMQPPIYRCVANHSVCPRCRPLLSSCPTCQGDMTTLRSEDLEKRCLAILMQCRLCEQQVPAVLYEAHVQLCEASGVDL